MENNERETFHYTYSAKQQEEVENIRKKYTVPQEDKLQQLRLLDASVTKKATMISIMVGVIGALLMGGGMSLIMSDLGQNLGIQPKISLLIGMIVGICGMILIACAYPLYNKTLKEEREKIAPKILQLTDELMK